MTFDEMMERQPAVKAVRPITIYKNEKGEVVGCRVANLPDDVDAADQAAWAEESFQRLKRWFKSEDELAPPDQRHREPPEREPGQDPGHV